MNYYFKQMGDNISANFSILFFYSDAKSWRYSKQIIFFLTKFISNVFFNFFLVFLIKISNFLGILVNL